MAGRKRFDGRIILLKRNSTTNADYSVEETFTEKTVYANIDRVKDNTTNAADQNNIRLGKTFLIRKKAYNEAEYFEYKGQVYELEVLDSEYIDYIIIRGSKKVNDIKRS